jgi:pimeloyl-ACP methyl ester carboxylesterase
VTEQLVTFGTHCNLSGVVTLPEGSEGERPAVLILNSGLIHRVGACRISVKLARVLSDAGHTVLRFDFASIGDSAPSPDNLGVEEGHTVEIVEALDFMSERFGCETFIVYGLCSGARDGFQAALRDGRVAGLVQIDGYAYRNLRYFLHHYLPRIPRRAVWRHLFRDRLPRALARPFRRSAGRPLENMVVQIWPEYPPRRRIEEGYAELVARGVRFFVLYTGSWADQYNYRAQFLDMFSGVAFNGSLNLQYMPDATHILPQPGAQERVLREVCDWAGGDVAR